MSVSTAAALPTLPGHQVELRHGRRLVIGRRRTRVGRGRVARVAVRLDPAARALLRRGGRLPVRVVVTLGSAGAARTTTRALVVAARAGG